MFGNSSSKSVDTWDITWAGRYNIPVYRCGTASILILHLWFVFRELVAGDNEFRIDHRQHLEEQAALAAERSDGEDGETKTKGRKVALSLGERDEFT